MVPRPFANRNEDRYRPISTKTTAAGAAVAGGEEELSFA
jgi:hypothetical protein